MKLFALIVTGLSLACSLNLFAATCPSELQRDTHGYWYSEQKPGWKSTITTSDQVTVNAKDFAGAVYSPKQDRLACVYKASDGQWVALVSNIFGHIILNQKVKDTSGKPAWKKNDKYHDFTCGKPHVDQLSSCSFHFQIKAHNS